MLYDNIDVKFNWKIKYKKMANYKKISPIIHYCLVNPFDIDDKDYNIKLAKKFDSKNHYLVLKIYNIINKFYNYKYYYKINDMIKGLIKYHKLFYINNHNIIELLLKISNIIFNSLNFDMTSDYYIKYSFINDISYDIINKYTDNMTINDIIVILNEDDRLNLLLHDSNNNILNISEKIMKLFNKKIYIHLDHNDLNNLLYIYDKNNISFINCFMSIYFNKCIIIRKSLK
jgi:hypothetical protein